MAAGRLCAGLLLLLELLLFLGGALADEQELRAKLAADPGSEAAIMPLVGLLHQQTRWEEAEDILEAALPQLPRSHRLFTGLGFFQMQDDDRLGSALENLRKAVELAPRDHFATNNLCDVHVRLQKGDEAVSVCKEAVRVAEHSGHNHFLLGRALTKVYRWDEAAESFDAAIRIDDVDGTNPNAAEAWREKASLLETKGRFLEAEAAALRAVEVNPTNLGAAMSLGVQRKKLGRWDEAVSDLRRVSTLRPAEDDDKMLVNHLGQTLSWAGRHAEAQALYRETVQQKGYWLDPRQRPHPNFQREVRSRPWFVNPAAAALESGRSADAAVVARPPALGGEPLAQVVALLERDAQTVKAEFHSWETSHPESWLPQPEALHNDKVCLEGHAGCYWKVWHVAGKAPLGPASPCDGSQYPGTCSLLTEIGETTGLSVRTAQFSELGSGLHIRPHCGSTNDRLVLHLGIDVQDGATTAGEGLEMVVADEVGGWVEGRVTVFDDSYEHEVLNRGAHRRVVLLLHIDHPDLGRSSNRSNREPARSDAAGQPVEEVVLEDDDDDDEDEEALPLTLSAYLETVRPSIPESARRGYAAALAASRCCGDVAKLKRASRAQLVDAGVKVGHARAIIHTAAQPM
eukprot:COSAG04_NODE_459_length_14010_cov_5.397311_9_plen_629_part_00